MNEVSIIGAGGHTRTLINILTLNEVNINCVYEESLREKDELILGYQVRHINTVNPDEKLVISKGDVKERNRLWDAFREQIWSANIIHPKALIEATEIGKRNQISAQCYLTPTSKIGNDNVVYSGTVVEHEAEIGNQNIITVNVSICGRVTIGNNCYLGAGSTILPNLRICDGVTVGAGAVVTKNIEEPGVYVGIPAKKVVQ